MAPMLMDALESTKEGEMKELLKKGPFRMQRSVRARLRGGHLVVERLNRWKFFQGRAPQPSDELLLDDKVRFIHLDGALVEKVGSHELRLSYVGWSVSASKPEVLALYLANADERDAWVEALVDASNIPTTRKRDFEQLFVLGKGHFGRVTLARHKQSGALLALKELREEPIGEWMRERSQTRSSTRTAHRSIRQLRIDKQVSERLLMADLCENPFVARLAYAFRENGKLYFANEVSERGDLWTLIRNCKRIGLEAMCFIVSQVVVALESFHFEGIVHRDIKLENIMLDSFGRVKLIDFGLAKRLEEEGNSTPEKRSFAKTYSLCGTSYYFSPEMISQKGHSFSNDWWQVGCLVFELLTGKAAFFGKEQDSIYEKILSPDGPDYSLVRSVVGDSKNGFNAIDLILQLLEHDPEKRLGSPGCGTVREHAFFSCVNWSLVERRCQPVPEEIARYTHVEDEDKSVLNKNVVAKFFRDARTMSGVPLKEARIMNIISPSSMQQPDSPNMKSINRKVPVKPRGKDPLGPLLGFNFRGPESLLRTLDITKV